MSPKGEYQATLNLPKTGFSMKAGLVNKEPAILAQWAQEGLYEKIREQSQGRQTYTLHDGPPYANGNIHMGHALNKILKDFIVKYKTMTGYDSLYVPGWDCHGLPIEHQLFKKLKKHKSEVDCVEFRKQAHDYAMNFVGVQKEQFQRLGILGQWDDPYLTLDPQYEYWILKSLARLNSDGYIYRGLKPVNWCYSCETALAEAEVEYEDHTSASIYVKFPVNNPQTVMDNAEKKVSLLVWTTTPWTLMANVAVAVHESFQYLFIDIGQEILIIEDSLSRSVLEKAGISLDDVKVVKELSGDRLTELVYAQPFGLLQDCQVVTADYVTKEDGTGLVHTAPGHGQEDYETGRRYHLDVIMPVDDRGRYTQEAGSYAGQHVFKANHQIIEDLDQQGVLFASEDIQHSYPHCWRCKKPIIFRATHQWFLKIDHKDLRRQLIKEIDRVRWIPDVGEARIKGMLAGRPDWCLSRQRYWGVPIPAVECKQCGQRLLFTDVIEALAETVRGAGTNAWFEKDVSAWLSPETKCPECGKAEFVKTNDILDVWFDSGVSHQAVLKGKLGMTLPIDLYLEGSDQHRGWFQSSLIPAVALEGHAPYREILTHGFVVDGEGRKMSKSTGNVISPLNIIKNSGADILRLWVAASSYNEDIRISKEILDRLIDAYRKIRNTFRYLLGNLHNFNPSKDLLPYDELMDIDKWALYRLGRATNTIKDHFSHYAFAKAYKTLYAFCNEDLSSFYLDILKDRLYTSATKSKERLSAQTVLYHIVNHLVRVIAPIVSFTSEEIYAHMPKNAELEAVGSVHLLPWIDVPAEWIDEKYNEAFAKLVQLRPYVLKALEDKRRAGAIGSSLQARIVFKSSQEDHFAYLKDKEDILNSIFIVSQSEIQQVNSVNQGLSEEFPDLEIEIQRADGEKCSRCWNYFTDLGTDEEHPTLCGRCTAIVKENISAEQKTG
jgi:isoleucyl-tRNA synthetase